MAGTSFYVLLALADADRFGLDIIREVAEQTDDRVRLGPGTLYNAIARMLERGLIVERPQTAAGTDPRRKYYGVTELGRERLGAETAQLAMLVEAARAKDALA